jgi:hypothetical protein
VISWRSGRSKLTSCILCSLPVQRTKMSGKVRRTRFCAIEFPVCAVICFGQDRSWVVPSACDSAAYFTSSSLKSHLFHDSCVSNMQGFVRRRIISSS